MAVNIGEWANQQIYKEWLKKQETIYQQQPSTLKQHQKTDTDSNSDLSNTKPDLVLNVYSEAVPIYVKKSTNPKEQFGKTTETKERSEIKSEEDVKHGKYCVLS